MEAAQNQSRMIRLLVLSLLVFGSGCLTNRSKPFVAPEIALPTEQPVKSVLPQPGEMHALTTGSAPKTSAPSPAQPESPKSDIIQAQAVELLPAPRESKPDSPTDSLPSPKAAPLIAGSPTSIGGMLRLEEVIDSVEQHYPLLRAVEQERALAGGRLLSTMGVFDFNLTSGVNGREGTYENIRPEVGMSQMVPFTGIGTFAGYRGGYGDFPTYYLDQKTAQGGEFRTGISVPLLKDRVIDRPRAGIQQARLDVQIAEPMIERQRLDFRRAAARTYWAWVAAGHRVRITETLVDLAVERDEQLKARVQIGPTANIERIDNQQNIALRNGVLVQAERMFQQASIDLSLFLRDTNGQPSIAGKERLPEFPQAAPLAPTTFEDGLQTAFNLRPEPRRIRLQRDKAAVELQLATNHTLPTLNAVVAASQDVGNGKSSLSGPNGLDRTNLSAGVMFQLPVQLREARGRVIAAQAQMAQLEQQLRFAEDLVKAEVQDTFSALERAYEFHRQARTRVDLAKTVARAERELLRLGRSDILRVTLREQAAFDAEIIQIGALQDYFRALADFQIAVGIGGK